MEAVRSIEKGQRDGNRSDVAKLVAERVIETGTAYAEAASVMVGFLDRDGLRSAAVRGLAQDAQVITQELLRQRAAEPDSHHALEEGERTSGQAARSGRTSVSEMATLAERSTLRGLSALFWWSQTLGRQVFAIEAGIEAHSDLHREGQREQKVGVRGRAKCVYAERATALLREQKKGRIADLSQSAREELDELAQRAIA